MAESKKLCSDVKINRNPTTVQKTDDKGGGVVGFGEMGGLENVALISECGVRTVRNSLDFCSDKKNCMTVEDILKAFNAPLSEDHAWALIYQFVNMYKNFIHIEFIDKNTKTKKDKRSISHRIKVPKAMEHLSIHKDGSVHVSFNDKGERIMTTTFFYY